MSLACFFTGKNHIKVEKVGRKAWRCRERVRGDINTETGSGVSDGCGSWVPLGVSGAKGSGYER